MRVNNEEKPKTNFCTCRILRDYARFLDEIANDDHSAQEVSLYLTSPSILPLPPSLFSVIKARYGGRQTDTRRKKWKRSQTLTAPLTEEI